MIALSMNEQDILNIYFLTHSSILEYHPRRAAMSDALCGPSNPLQNFQKQTQRDRTLQQDRITSRHSPLQVCR